MLGTSLRSARRELRFQTFINQYSPFTSKPKGLFCIHDSDKDIVLLMLERLKRLLQALHHNEFRPMRNNFLFCTLAVLVVSLVPHRFSADFRFHRLSTPSQDTSSYRKTLF